MLVQSEHECFSGLPMFHKVWHKSVNKVIGHYPTMKFFLICNTKETSIKNLWNPRYSICGSLNAVFKHWMNFESYLPYSVHKSSVVRVLCLWSYNIHTGHKLVLRRLEWDWARLRCWGHKAWTNQHVICAPCGTCIYTWSYFIVLQGKHKYKPWTVRERMKY